MKTQLRNQRSTNDAQKKISKPESHFVLKPFVQTPDAEIKLAGDESMHPRWAHTWDRKCGNPAVSILQRPKKARL